ncbi:flagellar hook-basal body protein [Massilia endophytica]|uniref:flagellar hook-basal body protein n=1 Tax=Massilia endophytica TaxID=2899220 RepID=UPI001E3C4C9A|nr:flagellar hook basal-body protein [Massilia endophytica]UGQ47960.1 flagellar hook basal-body protein [Massilia endophytica]
MMSNAFAIAETGMKAFQAHVDTIANNVANSRTPGFKSARVEFHELLEAAPAAPGPAALPAMLGVAARTRTADFSAGHLLPSTSELDIAIDGPGFIPVLAPDGTRAYSRGGALHVTDSGTLALAGGELEPRIYVPAGGGALHISAEGVVAARTAQGLQEVGRISLAQFPDPGALRLLGNGLAAPAEGAGPPTIGAAGREGAGRIVQQSLEDSNVDVTRELVSLMAAQRAYALNAKVLQAADGLVASANELMK